MSNKYFIPEGKDPQTWEMAQKRVEFKRHFQVYLVVNALFWMLWIMGSQEDRSGLPWPVFPGLGWGIGLVFHFLGAYGGTRNNSVEDEYNKLMNRKS